MHLLFPILILHLPRLPRSRPQTLRSHATLKEPEQRNHKSRPERIVHIAEVPRLERELGPERRPLRLDITQDVQPAGLPLKLPREDRRKHDDEEAVGDVGHPVHARLQPALDLAQHEDDGDGAETDSAGQLVRFAAVAEEEEDLVEAGTVAGAGGVRGGGVEAHFGDELVDDDDDADGADEAAEEGAGEDGVEEAEAAEAGAEDDGACEAGDHAGDLGADVVFVVCVVAAVDGFADHAAG